MVAVWTEPFQLPDSFMRYKRLSGFPRAWLAESLGVPHVSAGALTLRALPWVLALAGPLVATVLLEAFRSGSAFLPPQAGRDVSSPFRPVWFGEEWACTQGEVSVPERVLCLRALLKERRCDADVLPAVALRVPASTHHKSPTLPALPG